MEKEIQRKESINGILTDAHLELIREFAKGIEYGTLTLVFQNGLLLQVDRNEKIRLD